MTSGKPVLYGRGNEEIGNLGLVQICCHRNANCFLTSSLDICQNLEKSTKTSVYISGGLPLQANMGQKLKIPAPSEAALHLVLRMEVQLSWNLIIKSRICFYRTIQADLTTVDSTFKDQQVKGHPCI